MSKTPHLAVMCRAYITSTHTVNLITKSEVCSFISFKHRKERQNLTMGHVALTTPILGIVCNPNANNLINVKKLNSLKQLVRTTVAMSHN